YRRSERELYPGGITGQSGDIAEGGRGLRPSWRNIRAGKCHALLLVHLHKPIALVLFQISLEKSLSDALEHLRLELRCKFRDVVKNLRNLGRNNLMVSAIAL